MNFKKLKLLAKLATSALAVNAVGLGAQVKAMENDRDKKLEKTIDTVLRGVLGPLGSPALRHQFVDMMLSATQCLLVDYPGSNVDLNSQQFYTNLRNSATTLRHTANYELDLGFRMKDDEVPIATYTMNLQPAVMDFCELLQSIDAWATEDNKTILVGKLFDYINQNLTDDFLAGR